MKRFLSLYLLHLQPVRRERLFIASAAFFVSFGLIRGVTLLIRLNIGPFHNVTAGGTHIHHLVWGILLILLVGYLWLLELGTSQTGIALRLTAAAFGVGAALTLDEFALWLNLKDVYWEQQGRVSVDAVALFGALLLAWFWGAPFIHAMVRDVHAAVRGAIGLEKKAEKAVEAIEELPSEIAHHHPGK